MFGLQRATQLDQTCQLGKPEVRLEVFCSGLVEVEHFEQDAVWTFDHRVAQRPVGLDGAWRPSGAAKSFDRRFEVVDLHAEVMNRSSLVRGLVIQIDAATSDIKEDVAAARHRFIGHDRGAKTVLPEFDRVVEISGHQMGVVQSCSVFGHEAILSHEVRKLKELASPGHDRPSTRFRKERIRCTSRASNAEPSDWKMS